MNATIVAYLVFAALVLGFIAIWDDRRRERRVLPAAHPARRVPVKRRVPGLPVDGAPLSDFEKRQLGRIDMDSMIGHPEVFYDREAR